MKKPILLSILTAIALAPSANAQLGSTKALNTSRAQLIDKIAQKETYLYNAISKYVIETLDTTPTRAEVQQYYTLSNSWFTNYRNEPCDDTDTDNLCDNNTDGGITLDFDTTTQKLILGNILGDPSTVSDYTKNYYQYVTPNRNSAAETSSDYTESSYSFIATDGLTETIDIIEDATADDTISASVTAPADTSQVWLSPNGDGTFTQSIYNDTDSKWESQGTVTSSSTTSIATTNLTFYTEDNFNPDTTLGKKGWTAKVEENGAFTPYTHNGTKWLPDSSSLNNATVAKLSGDTASDINSLVDRGEEKWYSAPVDSTVEVKNLLANPSVIFQKYTDYWKTTSKYPIVDFNGAGNIDRNIYVAQNLADLPTDDLEGSVAYLVQNNYAGYKGDNMQFEAVFTSGAWVNATKTLDDLVNDAFPTYGDYWVMETKSLFQNQGYATDSTTNDYTYWKEDTVDSDPIVITKGDRTDLPSASDKYRQNITYILGDDIHSTSSGIQSKYLKSNGSPMYKWSYSSSSHESVTNNMTDAQTTESIDGAYKFSDGESAQSCSEYYAKSIDELPSGIYSIKPEGYSIPFDTYCDMSTPTKEPTCLAGYVYLPGSQGIEGSSKGWCVAKYEMSPYSEDTDNFYQCADYNTYMSNTDGDTTCSSNTATDFDATTRVTSQSGVAPVTQVSHDDAHSLADNDWIVDQSGNPITDAIPMKYNVHVQLLKNIALNANNWSGGSVGSGYIYSGNNDNSQVDIGGDTSHALAASSDDTDGYSGTDNSNGNQKRTHYLANNQVIWDVAGNVWEILYENQDIGGDEGWKEYTSKIDTHPFDPAYILDRQWNSAQGTGKSYSANGSPSISNIGTDNSYWLLVSGSWYDGSDAGVFTSYWTGGSLSYRYGTVGFRSIYPAP